jgi:preprotein translocase subunit SecA
MALVDKFFNKILGSNTDRYLKKIAPVVAEINSLETKVKLLSDDELRARTDRFKERIQNAIGGIEDKTERRKREQEVLHEILPEAFATVREASVRVTGMRHFDVQLIGGLVLHQGKIAEMRTGEGKTLVRGLLIDEAKISARRIRRNFPAQDRVCSFVHCGGWSWSEPVFDCAFCL